jgi:hypothetical protein
VQPDVRPVRIRLNACLNILQTQIGVQIVGRRVILALPLRIQEVLVWNTGAETYQEELRNGPIPGRVRKLFWTTLGFSREIHFPRTHPLWPNSVSSHVQSCRQAYNCPNDWFIESNVVWNKAIPNTRLNNVWTTQFWSKISEVKGLMLVCRCAMPSIHTGLPVRRVSF